MDSCTPTERRQFKHEEPTTQKTEKQAVEMEEEMTHSKDDQLLRSSLSFKEHSMLQTPCDVLRCSSTTVTQCCCRSPIDLKHNSEKCCGHQQPTQCCRQNSRRETVVTFEPDQRGKCATTYTKMIETPSKDAMKRRGLCRYFLCTSVTSCLLSCLVIIPVCVVLVRSRTNEQVS